MCPYPTPRPHRVKLLKTIPCHLPYSKSKDYNIYRTRSNEKKNTSPSVAGKITPISSYFAKCKPAAKVFLCLKIKDDRANFHCAFRQILRPVFYSTFENFVH